MSWSVLEALLNKPEEVRKMLRARGYSTDLVDEFLRVDREWKELKRRVEELRHEHNIITKNMRSVKNPDERRILIEKARKIIQDLEDLEKRLKDLENMRTALLRRFPNLIREEVYQICPEDAEEVPLRYWGRPRVYREDLEKFLNEVRKTGHDVEYEVIDWKPIGHADMLENVLKLGDTEKAGEVAGSRFFYIFDDIVWLDLALAMYALDFLSQRGFRIVIPPYMLKHEYMTSVIDFDALKDAIYKIEGEDLYLIGTSEHPLACYLAKRELLEQDLPLLLAGYSPCFRKEASAGNRDLKGIFRVHQFHKVEQFIFCLPEESDKWQEFLINNAEELWRGLGIPHRVVLVCPKEMGRTAVKQYDLEVWMPAQATFREMVSCSNCTDWQSYRLHIRVVRKGMRREYVHTLNSTAIATTRAITAILENNQEPDGVVKIPKVLRKYLEPFPNAPKDYIVPRNLKR